MMERLTSFSRVSRRSKASVSTVNGGGHSELARGTSIDESEREYFWKLAQRFYLSFDMVKEAKEVFDRYREIEQDLVLGTGSPRGGPPGASAAPRMSLAPPHSDSVLSTSQQMTESPTTAQAPSPNAPTAPPAAAGLSLSSEQLSFVSQAQRRASGSATATLSFNALPPPSALPPADELGVPGLQAFYLDLGIPKSALEIADVIQLMRSYPAELALLKRKEAAERELQVQQRRERELMEQGTLSGQSSRSSSKQAKKSKKGTGGAGASKTSQGPSVSEKDTASSGTHPVSDGEKRFLTSDALTSDAVIRAETTSLEGSNAKGLTFPLFLVLLQNRLCDEDGTPENKDAEVIQAFHSLDADHDGVLSEGDIQRALIYLLQEEGVLFNDRDLIELAAMNPVELRSAIMECDMNADGLVTADDLLAVLRV